MVEGGASASDKRLLVLGAGPAPLGLLEAAHERGLHVIAVDRDPLAPGFRFADRRAIVSVEDEPAIDRLAAAERVDGIVAPGIDFPVAIAARIAARLTIAATGKTPFTDEVRKRGSTMRCVNGSTARPAANSAEPKRDSRASPNLSTAHPRITALVSTEMTPMYVKKKPMVSFVTAKRAARKSASTAVTP